MDYTSYKTLDFDLTDGVLTVVMNRADAMNTVNAEMHTDLSRVFGDIARDGSVNAVVLTGAGKNFSAGGDITWFDRITHEEIDILFLEGRRIIIDLLEMPQPIIAAVNGVAAGLGATIALFCDTVFVGDDARILDPHVRIGVTAGDGGAVIWPHLIGHMRAKRYLMTGDSVSAQEAERIGLVNEVVPNDQLMATAREFAERLSSGPQLAIRSTKAAVNQLLRDQVNLVLGTSLESERRCFDTQDHKDAISSFLRKSNN